MRFVSLFAGIGGLDLGFERAGWTCIGQVEINSFRQRVLERHWPDVDRHDDVRTAIDWWEAKRRARVDAVLAGFPCQDVSKAARERPGIAGSRSGLYWEALGFAAHVAASVVVFENVPGLLTVNGGRDFGLVLDSLAASGFDAEWSTIAARDVGAPHQRERLFIVAYADAPRSSRQRRERQLARASQKVAAGGRSDDARSRLAACWTAEPAVGRMVTGLPGRVDRLQALGDAVVPQVAEIVALRVPVLLDDEHDA